MTRRFNFLFALTLGIAFLATSLTAQPLSFEEASNDEISILTKESKTPNGPMPKDMWEVSLHAGGFGVGADTDLRLPISGLGFGVGIRKSLGYTFSLRGDFMYGNAYGIDGYTTAPIGSSELSNLGYGTTTPFVYNYKATYASLGLQGLWNLTNIKFHGNASKLGVYAIGGFGGFTVNTQFNAKNGNAALDFSGVNGVDESARKETAEGVIENTEYDVDAPKATRNGEEVDYFLNLQLGLGIAYRINDRFSLSIEPQIHLTRNDYIDGRRKRVLNNGTIINTESPDLPYYIPIRLGIFLGDTKKKSIPLYWVNPLDKPLADIAANTKKKDAAEMLADKDNDGIPDLIDKEQDTPAGAEVDTRGVTLDSDKDGLPNHLDKEPYSPTGYKIDPSTGIAEKPKMPKVLTEDDILRIGKNQGWDKKPAPAGISDWFLPMIHFDNDRYNIKSQSYSALDQVATIMKKYPSLTVVAEGHASSEASDAYNSRLSYKRAKSAIDYLVTNYGISRSRFILNYDGETQPLVKSAPTNYMNRRVEFRVANGETEMGAPQ